MNKRQLEEYLKECFKDVSYHDDLSREILAILKNSGCEAEFVKIFKKRVKFLKETGRFAVNNENFKKLKKCSSLWRIKICIKKLNIRIIYTYTRESDFILLHAFFEKGDKNVDNYDSHANIAKVRMEEIENEAKKRDRKRI